MSNPNTPVAAAPANPKRQKALKIIGGVVLVAGVAWGIHWWLVSSHIESTDNAYVQANVVQITPQVGGTVLAIQADDTDVVKAGQLLVRLDPADARVALDQAEAQLAQTVREVRTVFANNATLAAQVALREADVAKVQSDVAKAQDDVNRRAPLVATGAVGKEEFNHAQTQLAAAKSALVAAQSALAGAREQATSNRALTDGTTVQDHPNVLRAAARVREAYLAFKRSDLVAPINGMIARRSVQVGQRVQAGAPLMSLVTLDNVWVDANFKESQLKNIRLGQPVTLTADVYGTKVEYRGKVAGLGAGTGAAFALLPAQNATGNWIKVVQRVPVRIALDAEEVKKHPLRVGLSMEATVDITKQDGPLLVEATRQQPVAQTAVFDGVQKEADERVTRIIASNAGISAAAASHANLASNASQARAAALQRASTKPAAVPGA
ncbi:MAG TPA: efflux RND transporter periplasmic adaptor subunit [Candidatus Aquabacterium excrementipullorum]|nr:efflux RND transporter periplasmic adaptor subunit [Candidatus Aquabacterium excrementipullorum]